VWLPVFSGVVDGSPSPSAFVSYYFKADLKMNFVQKYHGLQDRMGLRIESFATIEMP
jgi:hypothetical protein